MKVLVIQNQSTNSMKKMQMEKTSHSTSATRDLTTDSFANNKANIVSFTGIKGTLLGAAIGYVATGVACSVVSLVVVASGGTAIPVIAAALGGAGLGAKIGNKVEKPLKKLIG